MEKTKKFVATAATATLVATTITQIIETRSMPTFVEQRNALLDEMDNILKAVKTETRAMTEAENTRYEEIRSEIAGLDKTIKALEEAAKFEKKVDLKDPEERSVEEIEERSFANFIRGVVENRGDVNLTKGANGAVIPKSIAKKIIEQVKDISPIYQLATRYNVKGDLSIPYYDESVSAITVTYATEFTDLESTSGKTLTVELKGFLIGALSKVSKSLVNNSDFDLVSFVVGKMAESFALFIDKEIIQGTNDKILGLRGVTQSKTAASAVAITADELIDVQELVPDVFQEKAIWVMNKATRTAIRKLKDGQGNYLLTKDANSKWGYTLFGKDVYTAAAADTIAAGKTVIYYGDFSGLAVKLAEDVEIQVLLEKYATQHAIGVVGWAEIDSRVEHVQKLSKLVMAAQ